MKSKPIRFGALSCALAFCLQTNSAQAAVANDLDNILSAVGSVHFTSPASVTPNSLLDPLRPGADFGRVRVRIPHFTLTPVSFTAPSIDSSCSSLDIIGGSFTMMSLDDVIQVLRNITSGTLTYALGQSIRALCPPCWSGMQEVQDWINEMSANAVNSCAIAQDLGGKLTQQFKDARCNVLGNLGITEDKAECDSNEQSDSQEVLNNAADADDHTNVPMIGNLVYEVLEIFGNERKIPLVQDMLGAPTMTDREFVMNLIGTKIITPEKTEFLGPILLPEMFSSLVYGVDPIDTSTNKAWTCQGSRTADDGTTFNCINPTEITNAGSITPLGKVVKDLVLDDTNSIYNRLIDANTTGNYNSAGMSNAQVKLMNFIDVNVASAMLFAPNPNSTATKNMFKNIADVVRYDVGHQFYLATYNRISEIPVELSRSFDDSDVQMDLKSTMVKLLELSKDSAKRRDDAMTKLLESDIYKETLLKYNTSRELSEANF
ncbi:MULTISPECIES: conjugal transfer protein TraH [Vibrio]|nr:MULTISPECIES: conjugal transfer protein TraH [Vibrio]